MGDLRLTVECGVVPRPRWWAIPSANVAAGDSLESIGNYELAGSDGDVRLVADLSGGLDKYARQTRAAAISIATYGPAQGVVTFARPLSASSVETVQRMGVSLDKFEAISEPDEAGLRWTFIVERSPNWADVLEEMAQEAGVKLLGVIAANIDVPNVASLARVQANESVYLVDLSSEAFRRNNPEISDVGQNDVYWILAGWN